jgi:tetratricopeptide (TPR) repeat protein
VLHRPISLRRVAATAVALAIMVAGVASCAGSGSGGSQNANAATLLAAGIKAQQQGDLNAARQLYEQVVVKQSGNVYAHYNLGVIAQAQKDPQTALREYGAALTANPNYVPALFNEATIYAVTNPTLAIATYRQIVKLQPNAPTAYLNLGLLEAQTGQMAVAIRDLSTALHQDPALGKGLPKRLLNKVGQAANASGGASASASTSPSATSSP